MNKRIMAAAMAAGIASFAAAFEAAAMTYEQAIASWKGHNSEVSKVQSDIDAEKAKLNRNCGNLTCQNQDIQARIVHLQGQLSIARNKRAEAAKECQAATAAMCPRGSKAGEACHESHPCPTTTSDSISTGTKGGHHSTVFTAPPALAAWPTPSEGIVMVNTYKDAYVWFTVYDQSQSAHLDYGCVAPRKNRYATNSNIKGRIKDYPNQPFYVRAQVMETSDCKGKEYCNTIGEVHGKQVVYANPNGLTGCYIDTKDAGLW